MILGVTRQQAGEIVEAFDVFVNAARFAESRGPPLCTRRCRQGRIEDEDARDGTCLGELERSFCERA